MHTFERSTANIAARSLNGFNEIPDIKIEQQVEGLGNLDVEVAALVEINPKRPRLR